HEGDLDEAGLTASLADGQAVVVEPTFVDLDVAALPAGVEIAELGHRRVGFLGVFEEREEHMPHGLLLFCLRVPAQIGMGSLAIMRPDRAHGNQRSASTTTRSP